MITVHKQCMKMRAGQTTSSVMRQNRVGGGGGGAVWKESGKTNLQIQSKSVPQLRALMEPVLLEDHKAPCADQGKPQEPGHKQTGAATDGTGYQCAGIA